MAIFNNVIRLSAALILPILLLQGCVTLGTDTQLKQAVVVLEKKSDADSLAAAGLLRSLDQRPGVAVDLLTRATAVAPERADLAWLKIELCRVRSSCDSEREEMRLRALDPSNGAGWLNVLARANASESEDTTITVLAALGRTERVDLYWTMLIAHLTRAVADTHQVPLYNALVDVIGALAAEAIPAYSALSNLCRGDRLKDPRITENCRGLASALEHGDTDITEMVGVAIAKRVWPIDSPEWKAAIEARRAYEYRSQMRMHSGFSVLHHSRWAENYLALCEQNRREQDVERAVLVAEGKNPDPPLNGAP